MNRSHTSLRSLVSRTVTLLSLAALSSVALAPSMASAQSFARVAPQVRVAPQGRPMFWGPRRMHRTPVVVVAPPMIAPVQPRAVVPCAPPAPVVEPPSDGDGYLVLASTPLVVGQLVRSYWGSSYYPAQVTSVNADGTVGVHYVGWADMWDERAPRTHLRIAR